MTRRPIFAPKTFAVAAQGGRCVEARQLAAFTYAVCGVVHRFVVTELPGTLPAVTHRASGKSVCTISLAYQAACQASARDAAKLALARLIERVGAQRLHDVLTRAEAEAKVTGKATEKKPATNQEPQP